MERVPTMALEQELATYKKKLPEMRDQEGRYVLIQGEQVIDFFSSYDDAIKEGYQKFSVSTPFLVKRVNAAEKVQFISRFLLSQDSHA